MATSLVATIESAFNTKVILVEGHNGIYEVSINNQNIYTNQSCCNSGFPSDEMIMEKIENITNLKPAQKTTITSKNDDGQAPACDLPPPSKEDSTKSNISNKDEGCGCGCG